MPNLVTNEEYRRIKAIHIIRMKISRVCILHVFIKKKIVSESEIT